MINLVPVSKKRKTKAKDEPQLVVVFVPYCPYPLLRQVYPMEQYLYVCQQDEDIDWSRFHYGTEAVN